MPLFLLIAVLLMLPGSGAFAQTAPVSPPIAPASTPPAAGAPTPPPAAFVAPPPSGGLAPAKVSNWYSLLSAERRFAALCASDGMWPAFLATFSSSVLTFPEGKPIAVGTKFIQAQPPSQVLLTWRTAKVEVARSGDWGFTTGAWQMYPHLATDSIVGAGSYIIVWTRDETNTWKASLDMATESAGAYTPIPLKRTHQDPLPATLHFPSPDDLRAADQKFFALAGVKGAGGYSAVLAPDVILYRNDADPIYGIPATIDVLQAYALKEVGRARYTGLAASGDYGFTAGSMKVTNSKAVLQPYNYLHIWRRSAAGDWRLVLEMTSDGAPTQ